MEILYLLIGISILIALGFLVGFLWAVRNGQFDDDFTPAMRILIEDDIEEEVDKKTN